MGRPRPERFSGKIVKEQAESNQTSRMSVSPWNFDCPQGQLKPAGKNLSTGVRYQTPVPSSSTALATESITSAETIASPQASQKEIGMGTPQSLCRLMHQSGRFSIIP